MHGMEGRDNGTCLITGVASGIGAATAALLVADGWRVVGIDLAEEGPPGVDLITGDASDPEVIERALQFGLGGEGRLAGLVCAAGVPPSGPWDDRQHWSDVIRVDLSAPYEALRLAMPALSAANGSAVLIGSISGGAEGSSRSPAYAAAKAGVEGLARSFAVIGAAQGVRVNVVAPGAIDTPFDTAAFPADRRPDVPLGRMGTPTEVANVVRFLLSAEAAYVTGAVWRVDGGRTVLSPASAAHRGKAQP
jgi:meso-butanediol dehydrogenase / (S,S)-butanediol dehydrogenase / diacetyl reductase